MTKMYSFTPKFIIYLFGGLALSVLGLLFLCAVNDAMATKTVLETFPGTKSVCTHQEYNYSVKHTVCKTYATVPATCKKTETVGPIFDPYVNTDCN
jgi:hypothetical protein